MQVIYYSQNPDFSNLGFADTAVALGMFDGVHLGHKAVIGKALSYARSNDLKSAVITLANHPRELTQGKAPQLITRLEERLRIFEDLGIDQVLVLAFDQELMNTSAQEYLDKFLGKCLNVKFISTGYDHHFGKNRSGNIKLLESWCAAHKVALHEEQEFFFEGSKVSSSTIRHLLQDGDIKRANILLGHRFFMISKVIEGDKRGTKIGFPTANLEIYPEQIVPRIGVYAAQIKIEDDDKVYQAAVNIGYRPSFKNELELSIEAHILDFNRDIYGKTLELRFLDRIRGEKKFNSVDELVAQIKQDISVLTNP